MNWKEFLKPDLKKIVITIILFSWYTFTSFSCWINRTSGCSIGFPFSSVLIAYWGEFIQIFIAWLTSAPHIMLLDLVFWYFISSSIVWVIGHVKISEKDKAFLREFTKPTKVKFIISILGWITVSSLFIQYLSGVYGGIANFPPLIYSIYHVYDTLNIILLPFTGITFLILFPLTLVFGTLILLALRILPEFVSLVSGGFHPAYLTSFGAVFTFPLLSIEWYLISCLIVWIYNKVKKK